MDIKKLTLVPVFMGALILSSCSSSSDGNSESPSVSREVYDELQKKYDMLKESVEGTISANEEARMELNRIMVELNAISGETINLQKDLESGKGKDNRTTAERISESIESIKKRLDAVPTNNADTQTLALVENLRQTIALNEQEISRLNRVIDEKNEKISTLDSELEEVNAQLLQSLADLKKAEMNNWMSMGDELTRTADLLPDVKGHGNMKEIKQAKLTILQRAKAAYSQALQLGCGDAVSKIKIVDAKYQQAYNK
jgi:DNA repair exonuclease SbcCD ATPase subunit